MIKNAYVVIECDKCKMTEPIPLTEVEDNDGLFELEIFSLEEKEWNYIVDADKVFDLCPNCSKGVDWDNCDKFIVAFLEE